MMSWRPDLEVHMPLTLVRVVSKGTHVEINWDLQHPRLGIEARVGSAVGVGSRLRVDDGAALDPANEEEDDIASGDCEDHDARHEEDGECHGEGTDEEDDLPDGPAPGDVGVECRGGEGDERRDPGVEDDQPRVAEEEDRRSAAKVDRPAVRVARVDVVSQHWAGGVGVRKVDTNDAVDDLEGSVNRADEGVEDSPEEGSEVTPNDGVVAEGDGRGLRHGRRQKGELGLHTRSDWAVGRRRAGDASIEDVRRRDETASVAGGFWDRRRHVWRRGAARWTRSGRGDVDDGDLEAWRWIEEGDNPAENGGDLARVGDRGVYSVERGARREGRTRVEGQGRWRWEVERGKKPE
jgi:hypothetical protein